jgi:hypothetical protein
METTSEALGLDTLLENLSLRDRLNKDGYLLIKNGIEKSEIQVNVENLLKFFDESGRSATLEESLKSVLSANNEIYLAKLKEYSTSLDLLVTLTSESIRNVLKQLEIRDVSVPTSPVIHVSCKDLIVKGGYSGIEPHQDWTSIAGSLDSIVIWVPLTNVGPDDHPVQVIPGSHLLGIVDGEESKNGVFINVHDDSFIDVCCEPGDLVIFSTFCIHRTKIYGSGFRIAASIRYNSMSESFYRDNNYPCACHWRPV